MPKKKKPTRRRRLKLVRQALAEVEKLEVDLKKVKKSLMMMPHTYTYGPKCPMPYKD